MKPVVYVVRALPAEGAFEPLRDRFEVRGGEPVPPPAERLAVEAADAEVLVPTYLDPVGEPLLSRMPRLRHVASYGVGVNHIDLAATRRRGILVTNTPGVLTAATADHTFALLLAAARRVAEGDRLVRRGGWTTLDPAFMLGTEVTGKTLGVVGFGRIGQAVARRARGFEMRVLYTSPRPVPSDGAERVPLEALLAGSDFVVLTCPLTPETKGLVSAGRIALMKPGAILVNTARGPVVDDAALVEALRSGRVAAAGLDVFPDEPRVPAGYLGLENVVLTPHLGSGTRETRQAMAAVVVDEIARVASGAPPAHPVP